MSPISKEGFTAWQEADGAVVDVPQTNYKNR